MLKFRLNILLSLHIAAALLLAGPARAQDVPPLNAYGDLPAVEDVAISPSGSNIALVKNVKGERAIVLLKEDRTVGGAIKIGDLKIRSMRFIGDERLLVVRSRTEKLGQIFVSDKTETRQAMVFSVDDLANPQLVFGNEASIENRIVGSYGVRQSNGAMTAYFGGIELGRHSTGHLYFEHGRATLYEVDLTTLKPTRLDRPASPRRWKDWVIDANGGLAATLRTDRENGKWFIKNGAEEKIAEGVSPSGGTSLIGLSDAGRSLIYRKRDAETDIVKWYKVSLGGSSTAMPFLEDVDVERFFWDRNTGHLMGHVEKAPSEKAVFLDPANARVAAAVRKAFEGMDARIVEYSDDFRKFVVRTRGNSNSGIWFLVDLDAKSAAPIGDERPQIPGNAVGPISTFTYTAQDGLDLDGILTLPPGRKPKALPLVMIPHGGPYSHDKETFDWIAQAYASRGYAVFQPNFRGSTHKDDTFVRAGDGEWGGKMQSDVTDGLKALANAGIIDPKRACIVGASYGGYAALAGVTLENGVYRCAVAIAPVSDLTKHYKQKLLQRGSRKTAEQALLRQYGPESKFDALSPYRLADRADAPIMLIHGEDDTVVPFKQSLIMADALKDAGKPYKFVKLPGEDHWLSLAATRQEMLKNAVAFTQKHNPAD